MRASEIKVGESYAVVGKGISRARVKVCERKALDRTQARTPYFDCEIEEGLVYTGWAKTPDGHLDTEYVGPGNRVILAARDFVRPWEDELERRVERTETRSYITEVLTEMDQLLNALGLSSAYMQLVQTQHGPIAVTVLGTEELRIIEARIKEDTDDGQ